MHTQQIDRYVRNLRALFARQPDLAAILESTAITDDVRAVAGRDGSGTFRLRTDEGREAWLGRSSMPTVSASEILAGFQGDGVNILLPGVLTGLEPLLLAEKMPAHTAVFVAERRALAIKLALHLHEYDAVIRAGRVVFLLADRLAEGLTTFFDAYSGYELPAQLLTLPHCTPAEIAELQIVLEAVAADLRAMQQRTVRACVDALAVRSVSSIPASPRVAVVSLDVGPRAQGHARRLRHALESLHWPHAVCIPDAPEHCHLLARLRTIEQNRSDVVLIVNGLAGHLASTLPRDLPVASWFLPEAPLPTRGATHLAGCHRVFASSRSQLAALVDAGIPYELVEVCEVGADDALMAIMAIDAEGGKRGREQRSGAQVAVVMDVPDDRPEAANVVLSSHVTLWNALRSEAARDIDRYRRDIAEEWVNRAQRSCGVKLIEKSTLDFFAAAVRTRIAPAQLAQAATATLVRENIAYEHWSESWSADGANDGRGPRDATPQSETCGDRRWMRIVILPLLTSRALQPMVDAWAMGAHVVCRAPDEPLEIDHPGLAELIPYLHFYQSVRQLGLLVHRLMGDDPQLAAQARAAGELVRQRHTVARRLETIVDRLRCANHSAVGVA